MFDLLINSSLLMYFSPFKGLLGPNVAKVQALEIWNFSSYRLWLDKISGSLLIDINLCSCGLSIWLMIVVLLVCLLKSILGSFFSFLIDEGATPSDTWIILSNGSRCYFEFSTFIIMVNRKVTLPRRIPNWLIHTFVKFWSWFCMVIVQLNYTSFIFQFSKDVFHC